MLSPIKNVRDENDITGQRFGKLVALEKTDNKDNKGNYLWRFQCDCGNIKEVRKYVVMNGRLKSCGCGGPSQIKGGKKLECDGKT